MRRLVAGAFIVLLLTGCGGSASDMADQIPAARQFDAFPLYWVGERFEGLEVSRVDLPESAGFATIVYGTCIATGGDHPSCVPPLQIQIQPLCTSIGAVAADPSWQRRQVRGAPLGAVDSAPVLLTERVQVKVYTGDGARRGAAYRALNALRSLNRVEPVIGPTGPIPGADPAVLAGTVSCPAA